jgi:chaperone BCS1
VSCANWFPFFTRNDICRRTEYLKMTKNKTSIFEPRDDHWKAVKVRNVRLISTVIMNEKDKSAILKDTETYLNPRSRMWHFNRGFPYRKGYLLYGPPSIKESC